MKCSDVQRILPDIIDGTQVDGDGVKGAHIHGTQDPEFQSHLKACPDCSELVSDLKWIASESRQLACADEPPPRLWVKIAAELRAEGVIRDTAEAAPARPVLVAPPSRRWSAWWLAPIAAAVLAAGSYLLNHNPVPQATQQAAQQPVVQQAVPQQAPAQQVAQGPVTQQTANAVKQPAPAPVPRVAANSPELAEVSAPPADEDQQFLSQVSERAPTMRATYEKQLEAVNVEIRETQAYIQQHPEDVDARQHLMEIYQQKAMLYQMALDRIQ